MKNLLISTCLFGLFLANGCAAGLIAGSAAVSAAGSKRQPAAQPQPAAQRQPAPPPPIDSSQSKTTTPTTTAASQRASVGETEPVQTREAETTQTREVESTQSTSEPIPNKPVKPDAQADARPPVDSAKLRKEARAAASHLESLTLKVVSAFAKGKGSCSKVSANLRALEGTAEKSRTAIDAAKTRADADAAFRLEWEQALEEVSKRMEPKLGELKAKIGACKDDPEVRTLLGAVYPRV